ncbi:MAG: hypothetical protein AAF220_12475 [Pseudomonadota bacterium]
MEEAEDEVPPEAEDDGLDVDDDDDDETDDSLLENADELDDGDDIPAQRKDGDEEP